MSAALERAMARRNKQAAKGKPDERSYICPCDFHARTGLDPRKMRQIGLATNILYRCAPIAVDPNEPEPRTHHVINPCRKCDPPPPGMPPKRPDK